MKIDLNLLSDIEEHDIMFIYNEAMEFHHYKDALLSLINKLLHKRYLKIEDIYDDADFIAHKELDDLIYGNKWKDNVAIVITELAHNLKTVINYSEDCCNCCGLKKTEKKPDIIEGYIANE